MTLHATPKKPIPDDIEQFLHDAAASRQRQLDQCPPPAGDLVAAAHRGAVARILGEIRAAQQRLADGRYGDCLRCGTGISPERLEVRPWTPLCITCAWL